mgnify:CR=1 FL=1
MLRGKSSFFQVEECIKIGRDQNIVDPDPYNVIQSAKNTERRQVKKTIQLL